MGIVTASAVVARRRAHVTVASIRTPPTTAFDRTSVIPVTGSYTSRVIVGTTPAKFDNPFNPRENQKGVEIPSCAFEFVGITARP
jgi:hypothetical protein